MGIDEEAKAALKRGQSFFDERSASRGHAKNKKRTGLPLMSLEKKVKNYRCVLCKKTEIMKTQ